jgi:uncharacterized membrane protein
MAEHLESNSGAERVAVVFYGVVLLLIALVVFALWKYALAEGLVDPTLDEQETRELTAILAPSLGFYVIAILLGLVAPRVAVLMMLVIAIALSIPTDAFRRIRGRA